MVRCSYPGCVIRPRTVVPSTNGPSSFTRNHSPNCSATVNARQTRERGARSVMVFSIRSVVVPVSIGNLSVAQYTVRRSKMQPHGCAIAIGAEKSETGEFEKRWSGFLLDRLQVIDERVDARPRHFGGRSAIRAQECVPPH